MSSCKIRGRDSPLARSSCAASQRALKRSFRTLPRAAGAGAARAASARRQESGRISKDTREDERLYNMPDTRHLAMTHVHDATCANLFIFLQAGAGAVPGEEAGASCEDHL